MRTAARAPRRWRRLVAGVALLCSTSVLPLATQGADLRWVAVPGIAASRPWRAVFQMGCVPGDLECQPAEQPQHVVTLTRPYALLATEVTVGQFRAFVAATQYRTLAEREKWSYDFEGSRYVRRDGRTWTEPGYVQDDRYPVVHVAWEDAAAYCAWAGGRLPTEAEWEYAARAGESDALYVWGDVELNAQGPRVANVADETARRQFPSWTIFAGYDDGFAWSAPAGSFTPNAFGLWDMAGNAWEWVADWYSVDTYASPPATDPEGPPSGTLRVVRGSSWGDEPAVARASERGRFPPSHRAFFFGLRCARTVTV